MKGALGVAVAFDVCRERAERAHVVESLTPREREVLNAMAGGKDTQAIADALGLSRQTARGYVQTVMEKLGAHSRLEAVAEGARLGLVTLESRSRERSPARGSALA